MSHPYPSAPQMPPAAAQPKNGLGIAALVLGIIGVLSGFIPLLFGLAGTLGVLALIFGLVGRSRGRKGIATNGRISLIGAILGLVAIILGIVGVVITVNAASNAVDDINEALDAPIPSTAGSTPGETAADGADPAAGDDDLSSDVANVICNPRENEYSYPTADLTITNSDDAPRTYVVNVEWLDGAGNRLAEGATSTSSLAPGQSTTLDAMALDEKANDSVSCRVFDVSRF